MKRGLCQLAALHFGFTLLLTPGPLAAADLVHAKDGSGVYGYNTSQSTARPATAFCPNTSSTSAKAPCA